MESTERSDTQRQRNGNNSMHERSSSGSLIRRSWHVMSDMLSPFSSNALATLPAKPKRPSRYTRADAIPDVQDDADGQRPMVRDYNSINALPSQVRVPKKIATPVKVEGKVWFANERSASSGGSIYSTQINPGVS